MHRPDTFRCIAQSALLTLLATPLVIAQDPDPAGEQPRPEQREPVEWPKLSSSNKAKAKLCLRRLDDEKQEVAEAAAGGLVELGAGAAPTMLQRLDDATLRADSPLPELLDQVVGAEYLPKVLELAAHKAARVRLWAVRWIARQHDTAARAILEKACEDTDAEVAWLAWVGRGGLGDLAAIPALLKGCKDDFRGRVDLLAEVLPAARGNEMGLAVLDQIARQDELTQVAGLRLSRYLASPDLAPRIGLSLDHSENNVKKAAINALRVVVDGDEPQEKLSVFQAIEQAKAWQVRIR